MKYQNIKVLLLMLVISSSLFAQGYTTIKKVLNTATSPRGNYIYLYETGNNDNLDSTTYTTTDYFVIERKIISINGVLQNQNEPKKIGFAKALQTNNELKNYFTNDAIEDFKKGLKLKTNNDLIDFFKQNNYPKSIGFIYLFLETKMAMGHVFLDKDVKQGEVYEYQIIRVLKNKTQEPWGECVVNSKAPNVILPLLKPRVSKIATLDSMISFSWSLPISQKYIDSILQFTPKTVAATNGSISENLKKMSISFYKAKVFVEKKGGFEIVHKLLGTSNQSYDSLTFNYTQKCLPNDIVAAYLQLEDEVYNQGITSDTAFAYALEQKSLPIILSVSTKEVENGVKLSWKQLPPKPYIIGIEITKYNSQNIFDTVAILSPFDTTYTDYKLEVGQQYRYMVKGLYSQQIKPKQEQPAMAVGTYSKFSKPLPPYDLEANNVGKHILLNWKYVDEPSFYAFYIYRGTSSKNMSLIDGPIKEKTYLDTASSLSGRSNYTYAVLTQNLIQDTSILSNTISIYPNRKVESQTPSNVTLYYANGSLVISWSDIRKMDNAIESFVVQKKSDIDKNYSFISTTPILLNSMMDTGISEGINYEYRVAGINFKGDTTEFSNTASFSLPKKQVETVNTFYLKNVENGIEVSLPKAALGDRKYYNIYRREASEETFKKVVSINSNQFLYTDKTAVSKQVYVYAITVTNNDGREGNKGKSLSVRKD